MVDTGTANLLSATASIALNLASAQDVLGYDAVLATSFGIDGNYVAASGKLFLTGNEQRGQLSERAANCHLRQ